MREGGTARGGDRMISLGAERRVSYKTARASRCYQVESPAAGSLVKLPTLFCAGMPAVVKVTLSN